MNFDVFPTKMKIKRNAPGSTEIAEMEFDMSECLKYCKRAESKALINPDDCLKDIRNSLEKFYSTILSKNEINRIKAHNQKKNGHFDCALFDFMNDELHILGLSKSRCNMAHKLRQNANNVAHPNAVMDEITAVCLLKTLYNFIKDKGDYPKFDVKKVPIRGYEIVRTVPRSKYEYSPTNVPQASTHCNGMLLNVCDMKKAPCQYQSIWNELESVNYFGYDENNGYYFIKSYAKENSALKDRQNDTVKIIQRARGRRLYLDTPINIITDNGAKKNYSAYSVSSDTYLLAEKNISYSVGQSIKIVLDIVSQLKEMKKLDLMYRNINPWNVIITNVDGIYEAALVNYESAFIQNHIDSDGNRKTVIAEVKEKCKECAFMHPAVVKLSLQEYEPDNYPWDKAAVYSCAVLLIWCMNPSLISDNGAFDKENALEYVIERNESLAGVINNILQSGLKEVCDIDSFKKMIEVYGEE